MYSTTDPETGMQFTTKRLTLLRRLAYAEVEKHLGSTVRLAESLVLAKMAILLSISAMILVIVLVQRWSA